MSEENNQGESALESAAKAAGAVPGGYQPVEIEQVKFENPGDNVEGRLTSKKTVVIRGNKVGKYTLNRKGDGKQVTFLGGVQLDDLMDRIPLGSMVFVRFVEKEPTGTEGYELKRFEVYSKPTG